MADEREFTTLPCRAIGDRRLSGMDLRVLGAISLHDGLSLAKGKGQGCYAGDRKLAHKANTDRKNVKRSIARLIECGYLFRDADTLNRRGFVLRVIPDSMANSIGGEVTPSQEGASSPPTGGEMTPSIGGEVTPRIEREENLEESHRIDSAKLRDAQSASRYDYGRHPCEVIGSTENVSFRALLPERWESLGTAAQLFQFEKAFKLIGRDSNSIEPSERALFESLLFNIADTYAGEQVGHRALRLLEQMDLAA